jgi:hypothetical protein
MPMAGLAHLIMVLQILHRRTCGVKNKCFVIGCLFILLGYELAILLYVLSFPNIDDLWWTVFLGNWSRIFLEYVPKEQKDFSLVDVIMPLIMVCTVALLFSSFRKMLLTILLIELIVWQFLGLAYVLDIIIQKGVTLLP